MVDQLHLRKRIAVGSHKVHLVLKSVGAQWPTVTENNWLTRAPVFEVDLRSVVGRVGVHGFRTASIAVRDAAHGKRTRIRGEKVN